MNNQIKLNNNVLSDINYRICQTQAEIYEYIANNGYDLEKFSNKYLKSNFVERQMDTLYSRYQLREPEECLDFIFPEIGKDKLNNVDNAISSDIAYWIGFIYRGLYYATGLPSKKIIDKISFTDLLGLYTGFHTLDETMQLEKLIEIFKIGNIKGNVYE